MRPSTIRPRFQIVPFLLWIDAPFSSLDKGYSVASNSKEYRKRFFFLHLRSGIDLSMRKSPVTFATLLFFFYSPSRRKRKKRSRWTPKSDHLKSRVPAEAADEMKGVKIQSLELTPPPSNIRECSLSKVLCRKRNKEGS